MSTDRTPLLSAQTASSMGPPGGTNNDGPTVVTHNPISSAERNEETVLHCIPRKYLFPVIAPLLLTAALAMVIVGGLYVNDCPGERKVPVYLIVQGSVMLALLLLAMYYVCYPSDNDSGDLSSRRSITVGVVLFTLCAWNITAALWIELLGYNVNFLHPASPFYCNRTVYTFAIVSVMVHAAMAGVFVGFFYCKVH